MLSSPSLILHIKQFAHIELLVYCKPLLGILFSCHVFCDTRYAVCRGRTRIFPLEGMRPRSPTERDGQKGEASPAVYHSFLFHTIALYNSFMISFNACSFNEIVWQSTHSKIKKNQKA